MSDALTELRAFVQDAAKVEHWLRMWREHPCLVDHFAPGACYDCQVAVLLALLADREATIAAVRALVDVWNARAHDAASKMPNINPAQVRDYYALELLAALSPPTTYHCPGCAPHASEAGRLTLKEQEAIAEMRQDFDALQLPTLRCTRIVLAAIDRLTSEPR